MNTEKPYTALKFDKPFIVICPVPGATMIGKSFPTKTAAVKFANVQTGGPPAIWEMYKREGWENEKYRRVHNWRNEEN